MQGRQLVGVQSPLCCFNLNQEMICQKIKVGELTFLLPKHGFDTNVNVVCYLFIGPTSAPDTFCCCLFCFAVSQIILELA